MEALRGMIQVSPTRWVDATLARQEGLKRYVPPASKGAPTPSPAATSAAPAPRAITAKDVPTSVAIEIGLGERRKALQSLYEVARQQNIPFDVVDRLVRNA